MKFLCIALVLLAASALPVHAQTPRALRVRLLEAHPQVSLRISAAGKAEVRGCEHCGQRQLQMPLLVDVKAGHLQVNGRSSSMLLLTGHSIVAPITGAPFQLSAPLRITVLRGRLALDASLPVEDYIEAVLAGESSANEPVESLKALAVVARTFALHEDHGHHAGRSGEDFDLCDTTHCQVLRFQANAPARRATLETSGETLWYHDAPAHAYFHQHCGGVSASAEEVWPGSHLPYLTSRADPFCSRVDRAPWSAVIARDDLTRALRIAQLDVPAHWLRLNVVARTPSQRAARLEFDGGHSISAPALRLAVGRTLGWNMIRSDWYEVTQMPDGIQFRGQGHGHGVGLCQAGATEMAREGKGYREILAFYFPGVQIAHEESPPKWHRIPAQDFDLLTTQPTADGNSLGEMASVWSEALTRSELNARQHFEVRTYASMAEFRDGTAEPGWIAAVTHESTISLQPINVLRARGVLRSTLRHEFLHFLVEQNAHPHLPIWFREGLVEVLAGEAMLTGRPGMDLAALEAALRHSNSEVEARHAHLEANRQVSSLIAKYGRHQVMDWLKVGLPVAVVVTLR